MGRITIWVHELGALVPPELVEERFLQFAAGEPVPPVEVELTPLDKAGKAVTEPIRVRFPDPERREQTAGGGEMGVRLQQPPLSVKIKRKFKRLEVARGDEARTFAASEILDDKPDTSKSVRMTTGGDRWVLLLVAELFETWDEFHAVCREFIDFVRDTAPFNDAEMEPLIGFELLFAPTGQKGLFGTREAIRRVQEFNARPENKDKKDRRIYGSPEAVTDFLKTMRGKKAETDMVLVIVNSTVRGGAGGSRNGAPAWTTITGDDNETWKEVALHEMGHAFGLADEYSSEAGADIEEPPELEPNISLHADPGRAPWAKYWPSRTGEPWCQPSGNKATLDAQAGAGLDLFEGRARFKGMVGTFQGARYDATKYYRPAFDCRMNHTNHDFCPCCQQIIRETILAG